MKHTLGLRKKGIRHRLLSMTLIEVMIDAAIMVVIAFVVIVALTGSFNSVNQASLIGTAGELANEKLEVLRNMSYDSLATQHGPIFPQGAVLDDETVTKNNKTFNVHTEIQYVDDPYDSLATSSPPDLNPADYKQITITIANKIGGKQLASTSTNIASRAAETASNTGVIKITVLDAAGLPVANANLTITNVIISPNLSILTQSEADGTFLIPNLPLSSGYHVVASKGGYSTDSTNPVTAQNTHPTNPDASVLLQQVSPVTLTIDRTATLNIHQNGLTQSTLVTIVGQKLIGSNPDIPKTSFTQDIFTTVTTSQIEFDSYQINPPSGTFITTCYPLLPVVVAPFSSTDITCTFTIDALAPRITKITPLQTPANATVGWEILGANFTVPTSVSVQNGANPEVPISGMTPDSTGTQLTGVVDMSALVPATYSVIVRTAAGQVIQANGLTIQSGSGGGSPAAPPVPSGGG